MDEEITTWPTTDNCTTSTPTTPSLPNWGTLEHLPDHGRDLQSGRRHRRPGWTTSLGALASLWRKWSPGDQAVHRWESVQEGEDQRTSWRSGACGCSLGAQVPAHGRQVSQGKEPPLCQRILGSSKARTSNEEHYGYEIVSTLGAEYGCLPSLRHQILGCVRSLPQRIFIYESSRSSSTQRSGHAKQKSGDHTSSKCLEDTLEASMNLSTSLTMSRACGDWNALNLPMDLWTPHWLGNFVCTMLWKLQEDHSHLWMRICGFGKTQLDLLPWWQHMSMTWQWLEQMTSWRTSTSFFAGDLERFPSRNCPLHIVDADTAETGDGYAMDQQEFMDNMKVLDLSHLGSDQSRSLEPSETTLLRSILGGLLWITATRLDLVADVGVLQSRVTKATVQDLHMANSIVRKAKLAQYNGIGITYKCIPKDVAWRLVAIHDTASAQKGKAYSQEGVMILLMEDTLNFDPKIHTINGLNINEEKFGGRAHILFAHGGKCKRVSYSTSHSETLAAISGLESASLVSLRLAEILHPTTKPTLQQLAALQEKGVPYLPVDCMTDCKDFWSLTTGATALPQDRSQRVYILAHREARLCGRLRWVILVPTQSMLADALTKVMLSRQLLHLLSSGEVQFRNEEGHALEARRLPVQEEFSEDDLNEGDEKWIQNMMSMEDLKEIQNYTTSWRSSTSRSSTWSTRASFWLLALTCAASLTQGTSEGDQCPVESEQEFEVQKVVLFSISTVCMILLGMVYYLWKLVKKLNNMMEDESEQRVQPLITADLVNRMLTTEHNMIELQLQLSETVRDINILYRTARRRAGPHPEEPSSSRPRTHDSRPPLPEPEEGLSEVEGSDEPQPEGEDWMERTFDETASRSRDDSPRLSPVNNEFDYELDAALDDVPHDADRAYRRELQLRNRLHIMTIESNNMEHYLMAFIRRHRRAASLLEVIGIYDQHARSMEAPGTYPHAELIGHTSACTWWSSALLHPGDLWWVWWHWEEFQYPIGIVPIPQQADHSAWRLPTVRDRTGRTDRKSVRKFEATDIETDLI